MKKYSIIMPCLLRESSHKAVVEDCIQSVKEYSRNYELIIVDDGSSILTGFLRKDADIYIRHKRNMGIASSWNDGLKVSRGEYVVVINDDIRVSRGWLRKLRNVLKAGFSISAPRNSYQPGMEFYQWFPGFCFMFHREMLGEVGFFDERFNPANCEDTDYWFRTMKKGRTLGRALDLEIYHKEGDVLHKLNYNELTRKALEKFKKKHDFDPIPYFYGGKPIEEVLAKAYHG